MSTVLTYSEPYRKVWKLRYSVHTQEPCVFCLREIFNDNSLSRVRVVRAFKPSPVKNSFFSGFYDLLQVSQAGATISYHKVT
jgi:hypothetical protein